VLGQCRCTLKPVLLSDSRWRITRSLNPQCEPTKCHYATAAPYSNQNACAAIVNILIKNKNKQTKPLGNITTGRFLECINEHSLLVWKRTAFLLAAYLLRPHCLRLFFFVSVFDRNTAPPYVYLILDAGALDSFFFFPVLGNSSTILRRLSELAESWDCLRNSKPLVFSG
jgi:hypothetical protein